MTRVYPKLECEHKQGCIFVLGGRGENESFGAGVAHGRIVTTLDDR